MFDKYDSTDFWYIFINSLYNFGLASGKGGLEMDEETQEKLLLYLKEKIEEGVTHGETALPPGLHNYFWRFSEDILSKIQTLVEGFLKSDPDNSAASMMFTLIKRANWETQRPSLLDTNIETIPNDPCMNLAIIDEYRSSHGGFGDFKKQVVILKVLENLYLWAKQQDNTARYQEARAFYMQHRITPYTVYKHLKEGLQRFKQHFEETASLENKTSVNGKYKLEIKKCRDLVSMENAAFRRNFGQQSKDQQDLTDAISHNTDIWKTYLKSLEKRKNAPPRRLSQKDQEQLLKHLKTKIEAGVVDGKTTLPANLYKHISDFPEAMHLELREFTEEVFEAQPENGAAVKMLATIVWDGKWISYGESDSELTLLEKAMVLIPNDPETCFFAISHYDDSYDPLFKMTLTALERLFERAKQQDESNLSSWLTKLYKELGKTPCYIYRSLMDNPDENAELIKKCKPLITEMQQAFQQKLAHEPKDWHALRGLSDVYEALGETELALKHPWQPHSEFRWKQEAWVGKQLPDFSTVAMDGTPITFSDYRGKMLVLNFCAKSCGFCPPEIPYLKDVYEEYHNKGLEVIGVSLDNNETEIREFTDEHQIPWLQIYDGKGWKSELAQFFGINSVPSQWLIDRDGKILSVDTRKEQLSQLVKWAEITRLNNVIPDFTAVDVEGSPITATALQGKVVLLHFGYIHEQERTDIDALHKKHHEKGFEIIGINIGGWVDEEALRNVVHRQKYKGHFIYADSDGKHAALAEQFGFGHGSGSRKVDLPAYILIDTEGKVIEARSGKVHSPEVWTARLEKLITQNL